MRIGASLILGGLALSSLPASAQPLYPYPVDEVQPAQAVEPAELPPPAEVPAPAQPLELAPQAQPPSYAPPPPPAWPGPPPYFYPQQGYPQQGYPQQGYAPPVYSYPPPAYPYRPLYAPPPPRPVDRPVQVSKPAKPQARARFFSLGGRATYMSFNQQIGDKGVALLGGGVEMRFRTRGRFGLETSIDFLHGDFMLNAPIKRESMPIAISALFYIFPNTDARHFNLYLLGGGGVVPTTMTLVDPVIPGTTVRQKFTEYDAHLGVGAELRFRWIALRADVRGMSLWRDNSADAAPLYAGYGGAPVPEQSTALLATVGGAFWF